MPARTAPCTLIRCIALPIALALTLSTPAAHAQTLPAWRAAPQAAAQLGSIPVTVSGWRLFMPLWTRMQSQMSDQGRTSLTTTQTWGGKLRPDGTFPVLLVLATEMQSARALPTPDGALDAIEAPTLAGKADLVVAPREHSTLNGLSAAREYWKYTVPGGGQMHGFLYAAVQGPHFVVLTGIDAAPGHTQTLPVLEAAALSVQSTRPIETAAPVAPQADPLPAPAHPADALGQETPVFGYKIRPPQGYAPIAMSAPNMQMTAWVGTKHADGEAPLLMVARTQMSASDTAGGGQIAARQALMGLLESVEKQYNNVQTNPARAGSINGISAVYVYWIGIVPGSGARMHGFGYGAQDGSALLIFVAKDTEPTQSATLPVLDSSVMTFRH